MKLSKLMWVLLLTVVCGASYSYAQNKKTHPTKISRADKKIIVANLLDRAFEKLMSDPGFSLCTIPIVNDQNIILVESAESSIFPKSMGEYRFMFMSRERIEAEIKGNDGDCYFNISPFQVTEKGSVAVTLWRWINVITVSGGKSWYPARWVAAKGLRYKAIKTKRKWVVTFEGKTEVIS